MPHEPPPDPNAPVEVEPCPGCGVRLSVAPGDVGLEVACPYCQKEFRAVRAGAAPPPPGREAAEERRPSRFVGDDDRPSRRRSRRDEDEDDRPSRRRSRRDDDDYDRPRRKARPSEVTAIGGMLLGGGIYSLVQSAGMVLGSTGVCCLWPGVYYALVVGILAIVRGAAILNKNDQQGPPRTLLILQIILIVNFDIVNCVLGIVGLVLLNNPAVRKHYSRFED